MHSLRLALVALALLPLSAAAQTTGDDEPNVELGKVETFGPSGRLFSDGPAGRFFLLSRQSFAAEHAAGFSGALRIVAAETKAERRLTYEAICASERPGYRNVTVIDPDKSSRDVYPVSETRKPAPADRDIHNLYFAACRKQFVRFK